MKSFEQFDDVLQTCGPRVHLVRAQQPSEMVFIITKGILARERVMVDGARQIVGLNVPGDVCGLAALTDGHADYDMIALSTVSYLSIERHLLAAAARASADLSQALWREISREATIAAAWIANLGQRPAYRRIAYFMCELDARVRAAGIETGVGVEWPGRQSDLGAALGLSQVHINKTLRRLEADGLVSGGRKMRFHDIDRLAGIADFDPSHLTLRHQTLGDLLLARIGGFGGPRPVDAVRPTTQNGFAART